MTRNRKHMLLGALAALSLPASAAVVGVDINGTATAPGVLDPASRTWTNLNTPFALDAMPAVTATMAGGTGSGTLNNGPLALTDNYRFTNGAVPPPITITITGLDDTQMYDLAVFMLQESHPVWVGLQGGTATITSGADAGTSAEADGNNQDAYSPGENYVQFNGLSTDGAGTISFEVTLNSEDAAGILNAFEIQNRVPEYRWRATVPGNHALHRLFFMPAPDGQLGTGDNGTWNSAITLDTPTQATPGVSEWGHVENLYTSGTTLVHLDGDTILLSDNATVTSTAGGDLEFGVFSATAGSEQLCFS